jgi:capsule biosynthesis phosphatase
MKKTNLLIPINGLGNRFKEENYLLPKPLINVLGKPMIFWLLDNLNLSNVDKIIIPYTNVLDNFNFQTRLRERYKVEFLFFPLSRPTRGAAETVHLALQDLDEETLSKNIMVMDCDTFYLDDIITRYIQSKTKNAIFYFFDTQDNPIYSYIKLTSTMLVEDIREKQKISDNANCGVYCFESGAILDQYCEELIEKNLTQKNELYISGVYNLMLKRNIQISGIDVSNFHCVGTPLQLKIFCENNKSKAERFCFDLDGTLVTKPRVEGNYTTCDPIEANISYLKHLKKLGHYIIISTARRMRTHHGNINAVVRDIGKITIDQLDNFQIPYDELHFGKPYAHHYIDDLAFNCNFNLEKQTGYYNSTIKSRAFNNVEIMENLVIKSGKIEGERFYYNNIKNYPEVARYFPKLLEQTDEKIIIEKVKGINFSYMLINNCLSETQFKFFLEAVKHLHSIKTVDVTPDFVRIENRKKITDRYREYDYSKYFKSKETLAKILEFVDGYEHKHICMIHGDPVFTNILIDTNNVKLIDMRGKIGNRFTVGGDAIYDLAKIYQSLTGYDFVLNNVQLNVNSDLVVMFEKWVVAEYGIAIADLRKYTASLYFSLIPLHNDEKCQQYYQLARDLLLRE